MTIQLQDLVSELKLEDKLTPGAKTALDSMKGLAAGAALVVAGVGAIAAGFGKMVDMTFEWANRMDSVQDVMGGTNEQVAALNFVLQKAGVETSTFTQSMTTLEKGLVTADGALDTTGKKLAQYGINVLDANGKVKDQADLVAEISNRYNQFSTQQEKVNFLTDAFGKSGADLIDVFDVLAAEGGLDATTKKVEALGLAIDPEKYMQFQQNLEEIKLAGQGLAMTVIDKLMPALEDFSDWWVNSGQPFLVEMISMVDKNTLRWESIKNTWQTHVAPVLEQLGKLLNNIGGILERLDPSTEKVAGKFTLLGIVQREAVAVASIVNGVLRAIENTLKAVNTVLTTAINLWDKLRNAINSISGMVIPQPTSSATSNRATGGPVVSGQSYNTVELNKPEVFTPFTAGRIDPVKPQTVVAQIDEYLLGKIIGAELTKVFG